MPGGRPRKPTAIKIAEGNPGKRALPPDEPKFEVKLPDPPNWLEGEAREEWFRLGKLLEEKGVIQVVDLMAFATYCQLAARWIEAEQKVKSEGMFEIHPMNGTSRETAWSKTARALADQIRRCLIEFGLTPASRSRVVAKEASESDPLAEFLKRKKERNLQSVK